ncbi:MAG: sigma-70 family RNA polymerase sigma factor [Phaeodactylibacter sp.]|nr:sigma-70 family RNA polymerase sigma factor [Phaeodactylibacter sp.]
MPKPSSETVDYLEGIRRGDPQVVEQIYKSYHQAIIQLVTKYKGSVEDAQDVFQEGLVLIFQKARQPDFQLTSSFFTYFYAVCRNIWSNHMRKKSFGEVSLTDDMKSMVQGEDPEFLEQNEQYTLYRQKFLELNEECRELLGLFLKKVSLKEIAGKMGISSIGYAKKKKFKCKEKLVQLVKSDPRYQELITP